MALAALVGRGLATDRAEDPDEVRVTGAVDTYKVVYEVRAAGGPGADETVNTEILEVERPFRSLVVTREGPPPGGRIVTGRISDLNRLLVFDSGRWTELQLAPALAASDLRLDGVLDELVAGGEVERLEMVLRVADRPCQVHRFGGPIAGGGIVAVGSVEGEHADVCIDADGLVLSEVWVEDGEVLRRRTAVDVDVDVEYAPDTFTVGDAETVPATDGGGSARRVADDSPFGERTWELTEVPAGFERLGRWAVVWPRLEVAPDPFASPSEGRVAGMATVWVAGRDALVVEQGAHVDRARPFEAHPRGTRVELGALDVGEVITDARGTEVRVSYVDGSYVRVWSTLPREDVIQVARSLEPGPGGEPVFLEG